MTRRVLVTGGNGFLGSHVVELLRARGGAEVVAPRSSEYDLRDAGAVARMFEVYHPDAIVHLAARVGGIGANLRHPGTFFYDNMAMGLHVLEEARRRGTAKVLIAGTVCAYPKHTPVPFREESLWDGYPEETNAPYGVAKKSLLVMAQAYRQEFGCNFVMVFPTNLYGPRDNFDLEASHVIPAMIRKLHEAKLRGEREVVLWGDGSPSRDFLYVDDAALGLVEALDRYDEPEPMNLGSGVEVTMRALAEEIRRASGFEGEIVWDTSRPNGQPRRMLDVSRARAKLGFEPRTPLAVGLERTITWYRGQRAATEGGGRS